MTNPEFGFRRHTVDPASTASTDSDYRYAMDVTATQSDALRHVFTQLLQLVEHGPIRSDPALRRLFPDGYREDRAAADELRRFSETALREGKQESCRTVLADLPSGAGRVELSGAGARTWLVALTDARLVLGTRLDITADTDVMALLEAESASPDSADEQGPRLLFAVYQHLTFLQESLLTAMTTAADASDRT